MRITKENLTRYDQHFKSWQRRRLGYGKALENWKQTEEAGAVQFYPVGGSSLEGKVKFSFTETPPASGDKSPTNPSTISGVSSVVTSRISGKNLLAYNFSSVSVPNGTTRIYNSGITATNNNGVYSLSGTTASDINTYITHTTEEQNKLKIPAGTYTLSGFTAPAEAPSGTEIRLQLYNAGNPTPQTVKCRNGSVSFTTDTIKICNVYIRTISGTVYPTGFTCSPQLELRDAATAFEPSTVSEYTVDLGSTYYGGEIDLATGLMTVTHRRREVSGTPYATTSGENYTKFEYRVSDQIQNTGISNPSSACSHFNNGLNIPDSFSFGLSRLYFCSSDITTGADFSAWLTEQKNAGNPVVVAYKLNTPTTVQLDPVALTALAQTSRHEPRLNTVYTDADSIQITYQKSPIRAATEQEMAILGLGGNV